MAIFGGKKSKEEKQQEQVENLVEKYKLHELDDNDLEIVKRVVYDLAGTGLFKAGMALSFAKAEEQAKVGYLSALVNQNWIIIRKLDEISKKLNK